jgi:hypothetical protein
MILSLRDNWGFSAGNNRGIQQALDMGFESILLLNNDTTVAADCIEEMLRVLDSDPAIAGVCPKIYFAGERNQLWYAGAEFSLWTSRSRYTGWKQEDVGQYDHIRSISQATGCAMLVRRSAIERVGMLNPNYWAYLEDLEWSVRFLQHGLRVMYAPAARVWHEDGGSFNLAGSQDRRQYFTTRNLLYLCREHVRWFQLPSFLLGFLIFHLMFYGTLRLLRKDHRAFIAMFRGIADSFSLPRQSLVPRARQAA